MTDDNIKDQEKRRGTDSRRSNETTTETERRTVKEKAVKGLKDATGKLPGDEV